MPNRTPGWLWAGRVAAVIIVAGLVVHLVRVGLDEADKVGSAVGVVLALAALLAPYLLPPRGRPEPEPGPARPADPAQIVEDTTVGGTTVQVAKVTGTLKVGSAPTPRAPAEPKPAEPKPAGPAAPPAEATAPGATAGGADGDQGAGGQHVRGSRIGGHLIQAGEIDGDVTIG
ncbi:hypothetical protein HNP84_004313 [Thermocatellispora tengchongensis]|uniref:Uncharacterized protein n=1 Tax=Thermocatellispora tengchongensis TaxID=1073253 RepID=A0A840P9Q4_9ACTN|nr:hypothetical protein [Thermocatellispora tengchongensis]MBB5134581.1 hypothetical protein [Thermocatellispora tengchongensis]